jgi:hypothetical protein
MKTRTIATFQVAPCNLYPDCRHMSCVHTVSLCRPCEECERFGHAVTGKEG